MKIGKKAQPVLVDLGSAKKETRGAGFEKIDDVLLRPSTGISND